MEFTTDKQTLDDLNILGRYKANSIFGLFNHTVTNGGSRLLEKMFNTPLCEIESINRRSATFALFEKITVTLPFNKEEFEIVENYTQNFGYSSRFEALFNVAKLRCLHYLLNDKGYSKLREEVEKTVMVFSRVKEFVNKISEESYNTVFHRKISEICNIFNDISFETVWGYVQNYPLSFYSVLKLDYIFRKLIKDRISRIIKEIYDLDVYITVSNVSREKGFVYATAVDRSEMYIDIQGVYHPCIPHAVANDIYIGKQKHILFLTGANMAGKSTFMKSFAISVYLGHMGFPIAAKGMTFSLHDGIYTSINVSDDLTMGYSHFYAEVLRVKHVAQEIATGKQLVVIFDELFKGTNVKDAYDGTVAIVEALSHRNGSYIISTHIMEAGEILRKSSKKMFFKYLPTIMNGHIPTYPYKLEDGITDDHHGMIIIRNEKILEIING
ncbi:MAG: hypothetical protein VB022_03125 [Rikenellaceae bacterium]|nr:hypothetical protein [Rikenellaceae bacterium]